ncbi:molecular chaperone HtpG [Amycolatopsis rubida]|uniref:Chaperone protein HtpG n=1 Tax=Amycolatopsis rubida TaxID=112413 RepID=A0A1I6BC19_9PSEU|nr:MULTISPECIES: molecular chaperone HtpG [Amycolatopsis]MYW95696.1 molecular chaperone HtpG [Amycolatopsis rubida]NEC60685.1 molecular chaperone HtpG [Amycolatopsis rubida]OAP22367.1 Chaperone protein HtpG [Amycolatopsis sp. M39]SFQ78483.1 molecular chaperone HtpG [Amycolatopsis rubida]
MAEETGTVETLEFQSEARQLLQLMIHSIYSNKDIFLRELVSNASDALDKLRLETYRDKDLQAETDNLHIEILLDAEARTLTVRDNGIGMSRDDVVNLIGTIAKSGTADFLRKLKESKESAGQDLIGQFGVGFYASFMVADKVTLVTRRAGTGEGVRWESAGEGTYTIESLSDAPQGTSVTLHLKPADDEDHLYDYTSPWKVREIVKRYSDFITWPVQMAKEGEEGGLETVNSMKALWARAKDEVSDEEYHEFYKHISHDWTDPLETVRMQAEGTFEYQALLFLPSRAPMDLFMRDAKRGVQLYVKRVFIMDDCEALMPNYLRFVKGVVDAQDLSLNVSREILQQDRQIRAIRRRLEKKILSTVKTMMTEDAEKYATFWSEFGRAVKEGLIDDPENREQILEISSFDSTHHADKPTSLRDYVSRMKEGQEHIYYLTGDSRTVIENSPHLEAFRAKGYEVLILTDPVDEMWTEPASGFDGKTFQSVAKGEVDLGDETSEEKKAEYEDLLKWMSATLSDTVKEVRLSSRLTTSPSCIVGDAGDLTPTLEKMYRAMGQELPPVKRVLELNPEHALVTGLRKAFAEHPDDTSLAETAELLHGMALLAEGGELKDPSRFLNLVAERAAKAL